MKNIFVIALILFCQLSMAIDNGRRLKYYEKAAELKGDELKEALHDIIKNHKVYPYFSDTIGVAEIMMEVDEDPKNPQNIILFYTGRSCPKTHLDIGRNEDYSHLGITLDDTWNREHLWAKSHGFRNRGKDIAYSDVHNLRPADRTVNSDKGAKDFDWGGFANKEAIGCYTDKDSWEPHDDIKGDVARSLFYMAVRYEGDDDKYDLELMDKTNTYGNRYGRLNTLLTWHKNDPPDKREERRNEIIATKYQKNRNPFIDVPAFAELIWGVPHSDTVVRLSGKSLKFANCKRHEQEKAKSFVVCVTDAKEDIIVKAPSCFEISDGNGYNQKIILKASDGVINKIIKVRFFPEEIKSYNEKIIIKHANIEEYIEVSGRCVDDKSVVLVSDSFEADKGKWTTHNLSGNHDWGRSSYDNRYFMKIAGYKADIACLDWLVSPAVDLAGYASADLIFETAKNYKDKINGLSVWVSSDYQGDPQTCNWEELKAKFSYGRWAWTESGIISLNKWLGKKIHIGFKYESSSAKKASSWEVDDIIIQAVNQ